MREFFATILALAVIFATVWGAIALLVISIDQLSSIGVPSGVLYFSAGIVFACTYKRVGKWFTNYCEVVWQKIQEWIVWR